MTETPKGPRTIIACATVAEELRLMGVPEGELLELEFGLHVYPEKLRETLQEQIDAIAGDGDVILGYGLCSNAAVGLVSQSHRIIVPRVDDCIALFLGSRKEHLRRLREEPGTYFLTKGWIKAAELPINDYIRMVDKYGPEKALRVTKVMLANYKRVVLINTGNYRLEEFREAAKSMADTLELNYEEIPGSNRMLRDMLDGDWNSEYVIVEPGEETTLSMFLG
jgi:hypothetical protein